MTASWREPLVAENEAAGPEVLVRLKEADAVASARLAVTVSLPRMPLAVKVEDVAMPLALVVSVSVLVPLAKVPLAPEDGAVKTTNAPLTGFPPMVTVATRGALKVVLTTAL